MERAGSVSRPARTPIPTQMRNRASSQMRWDRGANPTKSMQNSPSFWLTNNPTDSQPGAGAFSDCAYKSVSTAMKYGKKEFLVPQCRILTSN